MPEAAENTVDSVVVEGAEAMLTGHLAGVVRATGKSFRSPFAMRLTVEDSLAIAEACTP